MNKLRFLFELIYKFYSPRYVFLILDKERPPTEGDTIEASGMIAEFKKITPNKDE